MELMTKAASDVVPDHKIANFRLDHSPTRIWLLICWYHSYGRSDKDLQRVIYTFEYIELLHFSVSDVSVFPSTYVVIPTMSRKPCCFWCWRFSGGNKCGFSSWRGLEWPGWCWNVGGASLRRREISDEEKGGDFLLNRVDRLSEGG